jgi:hypothetical protein
VPSSRAIMSTAKEPAKSSAVTSSRIVLESFVLGVTAKLG